jgi:23S rRNA (adenine2503-C2)-methyltransferase
MHALSDHDVAMLAQALDQRGHNPANAFRILREYWGRDGELDIDALGIAKAARAFLHHSFVLRQSRVVRRHESVDATLKLLVGFDVRSPLPVLPKREQERALPHAPGGAVECVLMPSHRRDRAAACISSQVGCAMGCDFCASTKGGLERNLGVGEIVEQFMHLRAEARKQNRRIASLVFMGMGEPMHNLANVMAAIRLLSQPGLGALGNRAITVSTVGVVPGIHALAQSDLGVHLALSLHAPDDQTRGRLVPSNRRWPVAQILQAAKAYQNRVGRPVNIEYCLLSGVNDSDAQAMLLAGLLDDFRAHVNLIPYNSIGAGLSGTIYRRPKTDRMVRFAELLRERGVVVHIRQTRGDDVAAACGQLRASSCQLPATSCQ